MAEEFRRTGEKIEREAERIRREMHGRRKSVDREDRGYPMPPQPPASKDTRDGDKPDWAKLGKPEERPKRIRLTVEWVGACSERDWGRVLAGMIEQADASRVSRVVDIEYLTAQGRTRAEEVPLTWLERLRRAFWAWG